MFATMLFLLEVIAVTACEGCVDWNPKTGWSTQAPYSHSLRGLCGLKFVWESVNQSVKCHSLRGLCGLKFPKPWNIQRWICHSLRGLCGLKFHVFPHVYQFICVTACEGCVDWNYRENGTWKPSWKSQPARAVWIEIIISLFDTSLTSVTACEGCVDWNKLTQKPKT